MDSSSASPEPPRQRPLLSVCIPAYNRARYLEPLLDSIAAQAGPDVEVVISEDASPEREQIRAIIERYPGRHRFALRYSEVDRNLGYDGNVRRLVALARGEYCFFMGNDDLLARGALAAVATHLRTHSEIGVLLRGYAWFRGGPDDIVGTVRYVDRPTLLPAGGPALAMCYRRGGVISGYVVARDAAHAAATDRFDGTLYYQMHLTAAVLAARPALVVPDVMVLCRDEVPPDFGAAPEERGRYTPGRYTPQARVHMLQGAMAILQAHPELVPDGTARRIVRDYARHFYPFVMDQLDLPWRDYMRMCRAMAATPVGRHASFYVNCAVAYALGRHRCDALILRVRQLLGRTPRL